MVLQFPSIKAYHRCVDALQQDSVLYKNMHEAIDGDQIVDFFFRQSVDVAKEIVSCATSSKSARGRSRHPLNPRQVKEPTGNSWWRAGRS